MGLDPWATAADVWAAKVHGIAPVENDAMRRGSYLERGILQWAADTLGKPIRMGRYRRKGVRHANLDAAVRGEKSCIEAKTDAEGKEWGEPGTDEVPTRVLVQVHHQMDVADLERCYVAVLTGRLELRLYVVERCEALCTQVREACEAFWRDYVATKIQPPFCLPSAETLALLPREHVCVELGEECGAVLTRYQQIGAIEKAAKAAREVARCGLINALGTADEGVLQDGRVFTYHADRRGKRTARVKSNGFVLPAVAPVVHGLLEEVSDDDGAE